jgi:hypothetical protein
VPRGFDEDHLAWRRRTVLGPITTMLDSLANAA